MLSATKPASFLEDLFDIQEIQSLQERGTEYRFSKQAGNSLHSEPPLGIEFSESQARHCCSGGWVSMKRVPRYCKNQIITTETSYKKPSSVT